MSLRAIRVVLPDGRSGRTWWGDRGNGVDVLMASEGRVILVHKHDLVPWTLANADRTNLAGVALPQNAQLSATFRFDRLASVWTGGRWSNALVGAELLDCLNLVWDVGRTLQDGQIVSRMRGQTPLGALMNDLTVAEPAQLASIRAAHDARVLAQEVGAILARLCEPWLLIGPSPTRS